MVVNTSGELSNDCRSGRGLFFAVRLSHTVEIYDGYAAERPGIRHRCDDLYHVYHSPIVRPISCTSVTAPSRLRIRYEKSVLKSAGAILGQVSRTRRMACSISRVMSFGSSLIKLATRSVAVRLAHLGSRREIPVDMMRF